MTTTTTTTMTSMNDTLMDNNNGFDNYLNQMNGSGTEGSGDDSRPSSRATSFLSGDSTGQICAVCGDLSSGRHYGAITCEGCKGFFRRIICFGNFGYKCSATGPVKDSCLITSDSTRRKCCKSCRFKRCLDVGMKRELCVKIETYGHRSRRPSSDADSDDMTDASLHYNKEEVKAFSAQLIRSYGHNIIQMVTLDEFGQQYDQNNNNKSFLMALNQMRVRLEMNVQSFVSHIPLFRELIPSVQKQMIGDSINGLLILLMVSNMHRYDHIIQQNSMYFGDQQMDRTFRAIYSTYYDLSECMEDVLATDGDTVDAIDHKHSVSAVLFLLSMVNNIGVTDDKRVERIRDKIMVAFGLDDPVLASKMAQVLHLLSDMNGLFIRSQYFY